MKNYLYGCDEFNDNQVMDLDSWVDLLTDNPRMNKLTLEKHKREKGQGFKWCNVEREVFEDGYENCGKYCRNYEPRNGKSGWCKHSRTTYVGTGEYVTLEVKR